MALWRDPNSEEAELGAQILGDLHVAIHEILKTLHHKVYGRR